MVGYKISISLPNQLEVQENQGDIVGHEEISVGRYGVFLVTGAAAGMDVLPWRYGEGGVLGLIHDGIFPPLG